MNKVVEQFQQFRMDGNITPHAWYTCPRLQFANGKPNLVAIILLADMVYWYRPVEVRDEVSGQLVSYRQKFAADKLQKNYRKWGEVFGFTLRQVEDAMAFLKKAGLLTVEVRARVTELGTFPNCAFIEPVFAAVKDITYPPAEKTTPAKSPVRTGDRPRQKGRTSPVSPEKPSRSKVPCLPLEGEHTKTPSETLKENTDGDTAAAAPDSSSRFSGPEQKEPDSPAFLAEFRKARRELSGPDFKARHGRASTEDDWRQRAEARLAELRAEKEAAE